MTLPDLKDFAEISRPMAAPLATFLAGFCLAVIVGGLLAYRLASRRKDAKGSERADIQSSADVSFLGRQDGFWIVELKAVLTNKSRVQRKVEKFWFNLNAIHADDPIEVSKKWDGQVDFGNEVAKGSFVPKGYAYCVIGPSITATYSYVARVPEWATFLILHCWFDYDPGFSQWMEKAVQVPTSTALPKAGYGAGYGKAQFASPALQPDSSSGAPTRAEDAASAHRSVEARER